MAEDYWREILAHRERLLALARRHGPSPADAEDVVHEAMLRCATFSRLDRDRIGQFLTSVTMRLCADQYRGADRDGRIAGRLAAEPQRVAHGPEDEVCGQAHAEAIEALVETLPERQRVVLADRARGLTLEQICTRRSLTYKAAESALARARGTVRRQLPSLLAGLTFLGGALRRRRVLVAATVPVVAVCALGAFVRLPFLRSRPPAVHALAVPGLPAVRQERVQPAPLARAVAVAPAPAPARHRADADRDEGNGRHGHHPKNPPILQVGDPDDPVVEVTNDSPITDDPIGFALVCVNEGVWVDVTDPLHPYQGCGS
jgi:RNA polymerase sigma factor (sigma-70 family)